jgi:hypothetical protein
MCHDAGVGERSGDRVVVGSSDAASPNDGALHWRITQRPDGRAAVTVGLRALIPGCEFPHLTGLVLAAPAAGSDEWVGADRLRGDAGDGHQIEARAPMLLVPIAQIVNLTVGLAHTMPLPVDPGQVAALVFGSLTNRLWVENDRHHLWLVDLDRRPTLHDWQRQIGTDPMIRRGRLVVAPDGIRVDPIDEGRLSQS